jgi:glucan phosphorylase
MGNAPAAPSEADRAHRRPACRGSNPNRKVRIVEHGKVKMGELSFIMAHKVNGVSALHTDLMKKTVFAELNRCIPTASSTRPTASRRGAGCCPATRR